MYFDKNPYRVSMIGFYSHRRDFPRSHTANIYDRDNAYWSIEISIWLSDVVNKSYFSCVILTLSNTFQLILIAIFFYQILNFGILMYGFLRLRMHAS